MLKKKQSLQNLRRQIDAVDEQILHLLAERVRLARQTGQVKAVLRAEQQIKIKSKTEEKALSEINAGSTGNDYDASHFIQDRQREEQLMTRIGQLAAENQLDAQFCTILYRQIVDYCVEVQIQDIKNIIAE